MSNNESTRKSHCSLCGKRLSLQEPSGDILWKPSKIDDKGIYCNECYVQTKKQKPGKPAKKK